MLLQEGEHSPPRIRAGLRVLDGALRLRDLACLLAALASWWRGSRYVEGEAPEVAGPASGSPRPEPVAHQELG